MTETSAVENPRHLTAGRDVGGREEGLRDGAEAVIEIGLLNNMPDQALRATERQFAELISAAAGPRRVLLRRFFLADVPRGEVARAYLQSRYTEAGALGRSRLDALIVTGQEPRAARLCDEPYWRNLTRVVDWAQANTISSIWSCLAAHAAVLHLDGVERHRLESKLCGLFDCDPAEDDRLIGGVAGPVAIPHSRLNDLRESELAGKGYRILMRSPRAGADLFVKQGQSLFVFLQGHPEYEAHSLLGEYRRDVGRFLNGEMAAYPVLPRNYFGTESTRILADFAERARADRRPELCAKFPEKNVARGLSNPWRPPAVAILRNWLDYIISRKALRLPHVR